MLRVQMSGGKRPSPRGPSPGPQARAAVPSFRNFISASNVLEFSWFRFCRSFVQFILRKYTGLLSSCRF